MTDGEKLNVAEQLAKLKKNYEIDEKACNEDKKALEESEKMQSQKTRYLDFENKMKNEQKELQKKNKGLKKAIATKKEAQAGANVELVKMKKIHTI